LEFSNGLKKAKTRSNSLGWFTMWKALNLIGKFPCRKESQFYKFYW
jgi:hypothetical protein